MSQPLSQLRPVVGTYVRCKENALKEPFTLNRFYKVLPNSSLRNDLGQVVHTLAKFEALPESYLNAFK